jgi:hypothetical protein
MSRRPNISKTEMKSLFQGELAKSFPPILAPSDLARMLGLSVKTVYAWMSAGRLNGSFRKRGKHCLILRDRTLEQIFNGPDWSNERKDD